MSMCKNVLVCSKDIQSYAPMIYKDCKNIRGEALCLMCQFQMNPESLNLLLKINYTWQKKMYQPNRAWRTTYRWLLILVLSSIACFSLCITVEFVKPKL